MTRMTSSEAFVEQLVAEGITSGCGNNNYTGIISSLYCHIELTGKIKANK